MRHSLLLAVATGALLLSCKASAPQPQTQAHPVVVGSDTVAMVTTISVGKKSTVSVAVGGQGNTVGATRTDNTGRAAQSGANGGNSQPTTHNRTPVWALVLLVVAGCTLG